MDVGCSINPALDIGQVCGTDLPRFLCVKAKAAMGSSGETFHLTYSSSPFSTPESESFYSDQPHNSYLLLFKKGRKQRCFRSCLKKRAAWEWAA